eukprot:CAMPEP_0206425594 /NCGR_PEP_ID=MMETSP0324_2-20121206/3877_1 /ASSEMBLY_ACC=CAM_ASM_000836 /TAXON_ID=2866 /ORGANISM="Crypthecodinium cohnii, Strain Seligo" /LENGTH=493 /DNA_ID=CAMNT_0053890391 /DNA_START=97 /DNA_END=1579 /DNA_ORIENTATION=+
MWAPPLLTGPVAAGPRRRPEQAQEQRRSTSVGSKSSVRPKAAIGLVKRTNTNFPPRSSVTFGEVVAAFPYCALNASSRRSELHFAPKSFVADRLATLAETASPSQLSRSLSPFRKSVGSHTGFASPRIAKLPEGSGSPQWEQHLPPPGADFGQAGSPQQRPYPEPISARPAEVSPLSNPAAFPVEQHIIPSFGAVGVNDRRSGLSSHTASSFIEVPLQPPLLGSGGGRQTTTANSPISASAIAAASAARSEQLEAAAAARAPFPADTGTPPRLAWRDRSSTSPCAFSATALAAGARSALQSSPPRRHVAGGEEEEGGGVTFAGGISFRMGPGSREVSADPLSRVSCHEGSFEIGKGGGTTESKEDIENFVEAKSKRVDIDVVHHHETLIEEGGTTAEVRPSEKDKEPWDKVGSKSGATQSSQEVSFCQLNQFLFAAHAKSLVAAAAMEGWIDANESNRMKEVLSEKGHEASQAFLSVYTSFMETQDVPELCEG